MGQEAERLGQETENMGGVLVKISTIRITINEGTDSVLSLKTEIPAGYVTEKLPEAGLVGLMQYAAFELAAKLKYAEDRNALVAGGYNQEGGL